MDLKRFSDLLGVDITLRTKKRKVTRARQAVAKLLLYNEYTVTKVSKILGCSRQEISAGYERFSNYLRAGDPLAEEYWDKIKDEEV